MQKLRLSYAIFKQGDFNRRFILAFLLFVCAGFINFYAGTYATREVSSPVTDIILSNTRVYNVEGIFIYGADALIIFIALLSFSRPKRLPFVLFSLSTFIFIRSGFISLTHIAPFPDNVAINLGEITSRFTFGGDLFFSGHAGIPFLMALLFWRNKLLRLIFLFWSIFFGIIVLLGHIHYSIDVASAYFITYSIYHIACYFFPREKELFDETVG